MRLTRIRRAKNSGNARRIERGGHNASIRDSEAARNWGCGGSEGCEFASIYGQLHTLPIGSVLV